MIYQLKLLFFCSGMKRLDCQEDMQELTRLMSLTNAHDVSARQKALTFVLEAARDLQRAFISYFGLDVLVCYATEDNLEQNNKNKLKPQLLE